MVSLDRPRIISFPHHTRLLCQRSRTFIRLICHIQEISIFPLLFHPSLTLLGKRIFPDALSSIDALSSSLPPRCTGDDSPSSVPPLADTSRLDVSSSDATDLYLPEHLHILFLTTVEEAHLSRTLASDFKQLLIQHRDTFARFAKSPKDIGFCDLLDHDIDIGDAPPIRQPPRNPPLSSGTAEDDSITDIACS